MTAATACRSCGTEPREGARFCDGCGAPVAERDAGDYSNFCGCAMLGCLDCVWCGVNTSEIGEFYMVRDELWDAYGCAHGCACIGCLAAKTTARLACATPQLSGLPSSLPWSENATQKIIASRPKMMSAVMVSNHWNG